MVITICPATEKDKESIIAILKKLDLFYASLSLDNFWVAKKGQQLIGTLQLKEYPNFLFLGSLAVLEEYRQQGIASRLIKESLKNAAKPTYLYTVIPDFFKKFGFKITKDLPPDLPSKNQYECEYCHSEQCVCMIKYPYAA